LIFFPDSIRVLLPVPAFWKQQGMFICG
jgi:hypothetical protein